MRKMNKGRSALMSEWMESSSQWESDWSWNQTHSPRGCVLSDHPSHVRAPGVSHWWCGLSCVKFLNASLLVLTCSSSVFEQLYPVALVISSQTCWFSVCELDPHYSTCLKWVISILRSHFFLLLKWVYYGFIFHCLSNRCCPLSEGFSVHPSHSGWVDCQMLQRSAELLMNAREVSGSASVRGRETREWRAQWGMG